jgi:hypothetical protein
MAKKGSSGTKVREAVPEDVTALLIAAREKLISGWCQGYFCEDKNGAGIDRKGQPIDPRSNVAVSFCLVGALQACEALQKDQKGHTPEYNAACTLLAEHIKFSPGTWNDTPGRTKEEVLAVITAVIER